MSQIAKEEKVTDLDIEELKKMALSIQKMESKQLPKGLGWFSRLMNRYGWHRKYEVLVFDSKQFGMGYFLNKQSNDNN